MERNMATIPRHQVANANPSLRRAIPKDKKPTASPQKRMPSREQRKTTAAVLENVHAVDVDSSAMAGISAMRVQSGCGHRDDRGAINPR